MPVFFLEKRRDRLNIERALRGFEAREGAVKGAFMQRNERRHEDSNGWVAEPLSISCEVSGDSAG